MTMPDSTQSDPVTSYLVLCDSARLGAHVERSTWQAAADRLFDAAADAARAGGDAARVASFAYEAEAWARR